MFSIFFSWPKTQEQIKSSLLLNFSLRYCARVQLLRRLTHKTITRLSGPKSERAGPCGHKGRVLMAGAVLDRKAGNFGLVLFYNLVELQFSVEA